MASEQPERPGQLCRCPAIRQVHYFSPDFCSPRPAPPSDPPAADSPTPGTGVCATCGRDEGLHWRWCSDRRPVARRQPGDAWDPYAPGWDDDADAVSYRAAQATASPDRRHLVGWAALRSVAAPSPVDTEPPAETQQDDDPCCTIDGAPRCNDCPALAARPSADTETLRCGCACCAELANLIRHRRSTDGFCNCGSYSPSERCDCPLCSAALDAR